MELVVWCKKKGGVKGGEESEREGGRKGGKREGKRRRGTEERHSGGGGDTISASDKCSGDQEITATEFRQQKSHPN